MEVFFFPELAIRRYKSPIKTIKSEKTFTGTFRSTRQVKTRRGYSMERNTKRIRKKGLID